MTTTRAKICLASQPIGPCGHAWPYPPYPQLLTSRSGLRALLGGCEQQASPIRDAQAVVGAFGQQGLSNGQFYYPRAIAATAEGRLFITDKTGRIQRFGATGQFEKVWETPAHKAGFPVGMGLAPDGRLFVADTHYNRVLVYDQEGTLLDKFGKAGRGPGEFEMPTDVAVDRDGNIYVSETSGNDRISKFDAEFNYIKRLRRLRGRRGRDQPAGRTDDRP